MKKIYIPLLSLLLFAACKKKKQYSTWYVNDEKFRTNDVKLTKGKAKHIMAPHDINNRFVIEFYLGSFPSDDRYLINCSQQNPTWCCMVFIYNGIGYIKPKDSYLYASNNNKKFRYTLEPTWFYNESDPNDSILVKGEFNEP